MATFQVPLGIVPSAPRVTANGQVQLIASGGSGSGYTWALSQNASGATIEPSTGLYTAGSQIYVTDIVTVTDGQGNTATREITVDDDRTSLANVRLEAQQRCDMVNSQFITTDEWNRMINKAASVMYDLLIDAHGNAYNVADPPYLFLTDGVSQRYPLPPDFYKLRGVDVQISNTTSGWLPVPKFNMAERNKLMTPYQIFYGIRSNLHYRLDGNKLWLVPIAAAGQYIQVHYAPRMTRIVNDTDLLSGIPGWEQFVIAMVCVNAAVKKEQDPSPFQAELSDMSQRLQLIAEERDLGTPRTVVDVRSNDTDYWRGPF